MDDNGFVGFHYMSEEELDERVKRSSEQMMELGINSTGFDDTGAEYDEDVEIARDYIYSGEEVPEDVRERLLERSI